MFEGIKQEQSGAPSGAFFVVSVRGVTGTL